MTTAQTIWGKRPDCRMWGRNRGAACHGIDLTRIGDWIAVRAIGHRGKVSPSLMLMIPADQAGAVADQLRQLAEINRKPIPVGAKVVLKTTNGGVVAGCLDRTWYPGDPCYLDVLPMPIAAERVLSVTRRGQP